MTKPVENVAYRATVTDYDRTISVRSLGALEADNLIDTAALDDDQIHADQSGRITITRTLTGPRNALDPTPVAVQRVTILEPAHAPRLSKRQYSDLMLICERERQATLTGDGRIGCGLGGSIAPAATARLVERGWVTLIPDDQPGPRSPRVAVSYAGRIAVALYEHRTTGNGVATFNPNFEAHCDDVVYVASCACGWRGSGNSEDPAITRGHAHAHRSEQLRAVLDA